ncbi:MAG: DNA replication/repair protein RecF [Clostridia bacterium]|nr:DNA replication/repair protein RecF [Clostridia bacterium]
MYLKTLQIRDFRNLKPKSYEFSENVNVLLGKNAQGKTNILEAIYLLSGHRSFRGSLDKEMIGFESSGYYIAGEFDGEEDKTLKLSVLETAGSLKKKVVCDGKEYKSARALLSQVPMTVFSPDDLVLLKQGPSHRRDFCDVLLSTLFPSYSKTLSRYNRIVSQKNALLKDEASSDELEIWNEQLSLFGASVLKSRNELLKRLTPTAQKCFFDMAGEKESIEFSYSCSFCDDLEKEEAQIAEDLLSKIRQNAFKEEAAGSCLYGPHRDDIEIKINGKDARVYASQGQQRSAVLALLLAKTELIKNQTGKTPIVLLDDVMSELDDVRRSYLFGKIQGFQVFITCCQDELTAKYDKKLFNVENGELI